jgi:membrane-bound lytic murein transglycosylase F
LRSKPKILILLLLLIIGCAVENNQIDVKGNSINMVPTYTKTLDTEENIEDEEYLLIKNILDDYGSYIYKYSKRYGFDWKLILSIIKQESNFDMVAESKKGAFGLMQIMPSTGRALANELNLKEVISPKNNISAGVYYLWKLSESFEKADEDNKIKLTLAAYNCGLLRVRVAQDIVRYEKGNPHNWFEVSEALKKLSRENSNLHMEVWNTTSPPSGYFDNYSQPIGYVHKITRFYNNYKTTLSYYNKK